jgi:hypothetical protein
VTSCREVTIDPTIAEIARKLPKKGQISLENYGETDEDWPVLQQPSQQ